MLVAVEVPQAVLDQVSSELQAYVYMLIDPESGVPFYVGKGQGLRHAAHLAEALVPIGDEAAKERSRKLAKIDDILARGLRPEVWILRYGLTLAEYTAVEAASIDLLMSLPLRPLREGDIRPLGCRDQLTNARREDARGHGVTLLQTLIHDYAAPGLTTNHPLLLITLNGWHEYPDGEVIAGGRVRYFSGWKPEWLASSVPGKAYDQIGESASAWWRVDPRVVDRGGIEHVAAVHRGVTRALFKIEPGSWETKVFDLHKSGREIRLAAFWFQALASGPLFDEVIGPHGHRVPPRAQGTQNPLHYWPHHPHKTLAAP